MTEGKIQDKSGVPTLEEAQKMADYVSFSLHALQATLKSDKRGDYDSGIIVALPLFVHTKFSRVRRKTKGVNFIDIFQ